MAKSEWPRCPHPKKDGTPCGSATRQSADNVKLPAEDGFCIPHAPKPQPAAAVDDVHAAEHEPENVPASVDSEQVASLREGLRGALSTATMVTLMNETLVQALGATKDSFTTCPNCSKRHPVTFPDLGVRASAVRSVLELLEGRMREERSDEEQRTDREVKLMLAESRSLSNGDLATKILLLEKEIARENADGE